MSGSDFSLKILKEIFGHPILLLYILVVTLVLVLSLTIALVVKCVRKSRRNALDEDLELSGGDFDSQSLLDFLDANDIHLSRNYLDTH